MSERTYPRETRAVAVVVVAVLVVAVPAFACGLLFGLTLVAR